MFLVDTSAWSRHLSATDSFDLRDICAPAQRVLCPPIYQELLQGVRDESVFRTLREILQAGSMVESPVSMPVFDAAIDLYRLFRRQVATIRPAVNCLIAACAILNDLNTLHHDRDFASIANASALRQQSVD